ncbi:MAG: DegT/DnrJ/EryC1/StrS family aminotransferase, partial [Pseudomonadota bacterium]
MSKTKRNKEQIKAEIHHLVDEYAKLHFEKTPFTPGSTTIPPSGKLIDQHELHHLVEASLDGWLTAGRFNHAFEKKLAKIVGVRHAMTTNSGSSANLLAVSALTSSKLKERALRPGDEVITVAAGFPTTVNPLFYHQLVPVFVDIDPYTYNIAPEKIESAVTSKTRAIILAHTLGNPFDLDEVIRLARKHSLWVIEDSCDALGSTYKSASDTTYPPFGESRKNQSKMVGTFGDIATISFFPAHHITMGEG